MRSIYDWESWFFKLNELELNKSDIVCDRTIFTEIAIKVHNQAVENEGLYEEKLEKWWYGTYLVDEYLKGIYGSNDKYEFAKSMRLQFMKATCKHPIEWDKRLFNCEKIEKDYREITNAVLNESIKNKLIKESEKSDIWEKGLSKLFKKNNFYFVNPIYFLNHLENAGLLEFNPYEKNTDNLQTCVEPITYCSGKDNPGFAPISYKKTNYKYNGIYYARITGHFNDWYGSYYHEGVDFEGSVGTPIHSFICGKVVMMKNQKNEHYGLSVLIKKDEKEDGKSIYYLLGHLSEYASDLKIGSIVYPGKVIGTVGNSGNCYTNNHKITSEERAEGNGSHLHLSFYKTKLNNGSLYSNDENNFIRHEGVLFNPFNHKEGRIYK